MPRILVVNNPFAGKDIGDTITDPAEIRAVLAGENAHSVVAVDQPDVKPAVRAADADPKPAKSEKE